VFPAEFEPGTLHPVYTVVHPVFCRVPHVLEQFEFLKDVLDSLDGGGDAEQILLFIIVRRIVEVRLEFLLQVVDVCTLLLLFADIIEVHQVIHVFFLLLETLVEG